MSKDATHSDTYPFAYFFGGSFEYTEGVFSSLRASNPWLEPGKRLPCLGEAMTPLIFTRIAIKMAIFAPFQGTNRRKTTPSDPPLVKPGRRGSLPLAEPDPDFPTAMPCNTFGLEPLSMRAVRSMVV